MSKVKIALAVLLAAVIAAAAFYYQKFSAQLAMLTPDIEEVATETARQDEAKIPTLRGERTATESNPNRNVYFGDLHVHTSLSFDAFLGGNRFDLADAYRFANGEPLTLRTGEVMQLSRPLDFIALTDHAESFVLWSACWDGTIDPDYTETCGTFGTPSPTMFLQLRNQGTVRPMKRSPLMCPGENCEQHEATTWAHIVASADRFNQPGEFTAFAAYEYSPVLPERGKVHRNVIFRGDDVPGHAASAFDAETVLDLWRYLERECESPCEALTIPHNMNRMWGVGYSGLTIDGDLYSSDDWALRGRSEPIAEMFQIKGNSECAIGAGAVDEECGFEQPIPLCEGDQTISCISENSTARGGLKKGLTLQESLGFNPLRFGLIGSSDGHNSNGGDTEEWDYRGSMAFRSSPAKNRLSGDPGNHNSQINRSPGGLAAIWAESNTRDALFDAMKRRETYATSGTRIGLRFFAGSLIPENLADSPDPFSLAYASGVPMGGNIAEPGNQMHLYVSASRDPFSAPLAKIQVVKGWTEAGEAKEQVIDIACAGDVVPIDGVCPATVPSVDPETCAYNETEGDAEMSISWQDTDFDPSASAFYYVRVLENPTCRWSTWDAFRLGQSPNDAVPSLIQERAWSSPIWINAKDPN